MDKNLNTDNRNRNFTSYNGTYAYYLPFYIHAHTQVVKPNYSYTRIQKTYMYMFNVHE